MFHRVKSEAEPQAVEENQEQVAPEAAAEEIEEQVSVEAETVTEEVAGDTQEETTSEETSSQNGFYQTQAPAQAQARPGGNYTSPSQYGRAASSAQFVPQPTTGPEAVSTSASTSSNDRRLTIGRGITMSGEIEHCDQLLVEGTVEAALKGANALEIAESGVFYGTVEIEDAVIAGRFEGEIAVSGRLTVKSTGIVTGSIAYKELAIEAGAVVDGRITPIDAVQQQVIPTPTRKASAQAKAAQKSGNEGGLFDKASAEAAA